jgi:catechol 2,3-dioxygenase-like lactoylglutathione lyase family enzyme
MVKAGTIDTRTPFRRRGGKAGTLPVTAGRKGPAVITTTIEEAKAMARRLRAAMDARGLAASHSETLELVAAQLGHRDWNSASAALGTESWEGARFTESIPVLRSLDEGKCRAFYCGFLGFEVDFEHRFAPHMPLYLGLVRGPVKLHLSEHRGDATTGSAIFVWLTGVDAYHRELATRPSGFPLPAIADQPWGREIGLVDPFGNRLRFCERPG